MMGGASDGNESVPGAAARNNMRVQRKARGFVPDLCRAPARALVLTRSECRRPGTAGIEEWVGLPWGQSATTTSSFGRLGGSLDGVGARCKTLNRQPCTI